MHYRTTVLPAAQWLHARVAALRIPLGRVSARAHLLLLALVLALAAVGYIGSTAALYQGSGAASHPESPVLHGITSRPIQYGDCGATPDGCH